VEITGPPEFLKNSVVGPEENREALGVLNQNARDRSKRNKRDIPAGTLYSDFAYYLVLLWVTVSV
jgi:hypothetical protein